MCSSSLLVIAVDTPLHLSPPPAFNPLAASLQGTGYYTWDGSNQFSRGGSGTLTYRIDTETAGDWRVAVRNHHDDPDHTESNDCWIRVDGSRWIKIFSNQVNRWNFMSRVHMHHGESFAALCGLPHTEWRVSPNLCLT